MSSDQERVTELRSLVSEHLTPYYDTHFNLLRWLQAYPDDSIDKIAKKLRHHLLFRKCNWEIDSIHEKERGYHPLHTYWPINYVGINGRNCLVLFEQSGLIDYVGIHDHFSITDIVKAKLFDAEEVLHKVMEIEKETGEQASVMLVIDSEGVEYSKKLVDLMLGPMNSRSEFMLQHYVELVEEEIQSLMDQSNCSVSWDNMQIAHPPKAPRLEIEKPIDSLEKLHVKAGRVRWMEYYLEKGEVLSFHLTGDSSFGITVVQAENEFDENVFAMRIIYPLFTWIHGPFKVPIEDTVVAPESGVYKMWFSNSRAWWSSVEIRYLVKVVKNQATD